LKIGIKTSAITFGRHDVLAVMLCYGVTFALIFLVGWQYGLRIWFGAGLLAAAACAVYHYALIRERDRMRCFAAFRHNNWLGAAIFAGIFLDYALR
jgi:4-hydroxybenzoate polyprenyltransferase